VHLRRSERPEVVLQADELLGALIQETQVEGVQSGVDQVDAHDEQRGADVGPGAHFGLQALGEKSNQELHPQEQADDPTDSEEDRHQRGEDLAEKLVHFSAPL
jgi:hypothetical protein